jgi:hypothetical protein
MWTLASDSLPEGRFVLAHFRNDQGNSRIVRAYYARRHEIEADYDSGHMWADADEEGEYFFPIGWYEAPDQLEDYAPLKNVTHWMPLPEPPADA